MASLRIGLVGVGQWGQNVLRALHGMDGVEIAWTAGRDWQRKLERASKSSIPTDAVAIAVPAPEQVMIARACLDNSMPVFLEKPMALVPADARIIRDRALQMGDLPVLVDHVHLFSAGYERFREELLGMKIERLEACGGNTGPFRISWKLKYGALWDYGPHEAAFALDLIGVPDSVSIECEVTTHAMFKGPEEWHTYTARLGWADGTAALLRFGNGFEAKHRELFVRADGAMRTLPAVAGPPPLTRALEVWLDAVRGEKRDERVGCALGIKVVELLTRLEEELP